MRWSRLFLVGSMALSAVLGATIANSYTITYDVQEKFYNNLGGDTGFFYDAVTLFQRTSTINITDGQTVFSPDFQQVRFDVGNTGPNSRGRLENFDASRDLTIEGIVGTLHQTGQVVPYAFEQCSGSGIFFRCTVADQLSFGESDVGFWNLAFGEDRKRLDVKFNQFSSLGLKNTTLDKFMTATFFLFNEPDNPIARLASTTVTSGQAAMLNASASDDRDDFGTLVRFDWDLNSDGAYDRSTLDPTLAMTPTEYEQFWSDPGTYTVRLRVLDNDGLSDSTAQSVTLLPGPTPAPATTVPEPATLATFASTALLLAVWYRRRRRSDDHAAACRTSDVFLGERSAPRFTSRRSSEPTPSSRTADGA
jgi:hypothetical protein